ncbi:MULTISPECIES: hypothetical protein [Sphingomonas]|uniref:Uncharacterized protein n=1 Tax=Sphingomonas trueperi TaxID=53317 RepID=A0A7X5Y4W3_9SPHN|nr:MULTISPECIES: hypothetical protein [Sphingomonas]NJB99800.1 hypothetical protein [Sphingomonas trueperi]
MLGIGLAWVAIDAVDRGLLGDALAGTGLSFLLVPMGFAIVGHLVWRLIAERQGDLIQQRHDAGILVAVLLGGMLFIDWRPMRCSASPGVRSRSPWPRPRWRSPLHYGWRAG